MELHSITQESLNTDDDPLPPGPSLDIEHMMERRPWSMSSSSDDVIDYMQLVARFQRRQTHEDVQTDMIALQNEQRRKYELAHPVVSESIRPTTAAVRIIRKLARLSF